MKITILNGNPDARNATFDEKMARDLAAPGMIPTWMHFIYQLAGSSVVMGTGMIG